jgi:hypothetical protein
MNKWITVLLILFSFLAKADQTIFGLNTSWKYLDNGSNQGTAWQQPSFNDAAWASGNAELGYGDGDETTTVSYGPDAANKYVTTYFRKTFTIVNVSNFTGFQIGVKRDDGVVVYVNGVEVWRDNISGVVNYTTLADADASDDGNTVLTAIIPASYFVNGDNVVAVEMHQFVANSSDLSFSMSLTGMEGLPPANQSIFSLHSNWKYLDNGTNQGTTWRDLSFNDSGWASGTGEFGYGDGDESTIVSYGPDPNNKYITTYFRKSVTIPDVNAFTSFQLGVKRDDGVVIYVNGVEVWRDNLTGTVSYNTLADMDAADDGNSVLTATIPTSYFVNGNNVIAAEVHQFVINSSDLSFDMSLTGMGNTPPTVPVITRGAYLNVATPTSIIVRYRTDLSTASKIVYGTSPLNFTDSVTNQQGTTEHVVQLSNLLPNTKYYYAIKSGNSFLQRDSTENFFITPPVAGTVKPTRIWVLGDMGFGSVEQNQVRDAYYNYTGNTYTDLWLWLGDNAYNSGTDAEYQNYVFVNRYERMLRQTAVWPSAGNHEMYASDATNETGPYYEMFSFATNGEAGGVPSGHKAYYSYDYANIHFIVLESTTASFRVNGGAMMTWLQSDLAANTQKWTVVYFHHPPYSKGSHDSDAESGMIEMRQNFIPILEQYKVDLVLSGHSHNYERSFMLKGHYGYSNTFNSSYKVDGGSGGTATPYIKSASNNFDGTVYAVAGTGGIVESVSAGWPHPAMYSYSDSKYGSMVIDVDGDTLKAKFIDNTLPNPVVYDQFEIVKQCNATVALNTFNPVCVGNSPFTLNGGSPAGGVYSGVGVSNGIFNPAVAGVGTHVITYTYTNGFCTNAATATITVTDQQATITPSGIQEICQGGSVLLSANAGSGYQWMLNGQSIAGATAQSYTATVAGNYAVTVTTTCGSATSAGVTVNVTSLTATVSPSGTVDVCSGPVVLAANSGAGYVYQWQKDGANIAGATSSTLQVSTAGSYAVVITNASGCTAVSNAVNATMGSSTTIMANGSTEICAASSVTLTAPTGAGITYQWYRNNSAISGATSSSYTASSQGIYYCYITVPPGSGCSGASNSIVVTVINNPTPTIGANGSTNICVGSTVDLTTNFYAGVTYEWEKNGVVVSGATGQIYTATTAGSYRVKQTANGCSKKSPSITVTATAGPLATITASGSTSLCNGSTVTLTVNTVSGAVYQWIKDGNAIAGATSTSYTVTQAGAYQCSVAKGCTSISNTITVSTGGNQQATITPSGVQEICQGGSVLLSANAGSGYQWMLNGQSIAGATAQSYTATVAGNYAVTVTTTCGSATSAGVTVNVISLEAQINANGPTSFCPGGNVTLQANTGSGLVYQWKLNGNILLGATQSMFTATAAGNYSVIVTANCGSLESNIIAVNIITADSVVAPSGITSICSGNSQLYSVNATGGAVYQWYRNNALVAGATGSSLNAISSGSYYVKINVGGCPEVTSNTAVLNVQTNPTPTFTSSAGTTICTGSSTTLTSNTYSGVTYQWQLNNIDIPGANAQTYVATLAGTYRVMQTFNGCSRFSAKSKLTFISCRIAGQENSDSEYQSVSISPNPFNTFTIVELKGYAPEAIMVLYDILGKETIRLTSVNGQARIDRNDLHTGIYILKITDADGHTVAKRLIVE